MANSSSIGEKSQEQHRSKTSFLKTFGISLLILLGLSALAEVFARTMQSCPDQPIRSIGNFHAQFETKWFKLNDYFKENGGVDVILMGNSMVNTGVDADALAQEYEAKTGVRLRIFNFGVEGMDIYTNSELADLLVNEFHPQTILFFTEMREYGPQTDTTVPYRYKTAAWFQYKSGHPSALAWLFDQSAAMQYLLPYRNWSRSDFPDTMLKDLYRYRQTTKAGYEPDRAYGRDLDVHTDPNDPAQKVWFDLYSNYIPDQKALKDFASILATQQSGIQMIVTEMPIYRTFYDYFGGVEVHQQFLSAIEALTLDHQGVFMQPIDSELIPLVGRVDNHHLNFEGAPVYSRLLADELAVLCMEDGKCLANEEAK